ncbi:MAG: Asp-tRNA(Asn)/Glu-tRNA(Gln) amidotransferase subunit GatC [Bacteroidales bacterium]|nr:Asp-tRNA(Asn)/Glu-tRNA(Gln) amidotransferase subunit GatC [Candidatus Latescibacterota bacterium]
MRLSDKELSRLEALARIRLETGERETLRIQLAGIIDFVRRMEGAETLDESLNEKKRQISRMLRVDKPGDCLDRETVLEQAPDSKVGHFRVPAVIDSEEDDSRM